MRVLPLLLVLTTVSSAIVLVQAEPPEALLVINEVLYDPVEEVEEWIELHNVGSDVNIGGVSITDQDGHEYIFPHIIFPSESYLLLKVGPGTDTGFLNGTAHLHMGLSVPILNNDGDDLLLEGHGQVLDFFRYGEGTAVDPPPPQAPWEGSARLAPEGLSLSLQPNGLVGAVASDWVASVPTPGAFNGPSLHRGLLISEVYYNANRDNEYIFLSNQGRREVELGGWQLSDGEGMWTLPAESIVGPGRGFLLAQNATALMEDSGLEANVCAVGCPHPVARSGSLGLSNLGDEVLLHDPYGRLVDAFYYGSSGGGEGWTGEAASLLDRGRVAKRRGVDGFFKDTNTSADWEWDRTFRLGQGSRKTPIFEGVLVKPFSSPEGSLEALLSILNAAQRRIILSGFTLTNGHISAALEAGLRRGVSVQIGLEGNPPGGMDQEQADIIAGLGSAGARVLLMDSSGGTSWRRYAFHHAKYVVVDEGWVVMGSENFSINGFPPDEVGNRGWGVATFNPPLARWLSDVAREDWNVSRSDVHLADGGTQQEDSIHVAPQSSPLPEEDLVEAEVTVLLSPDNALGPEGIPRILKETVESLDVELFYLRWDWRGSRNPLVEALVEAALRGVRVRILLDGSRYNVEGRDDNDEAAARLNRLGVEMGISLEARIFRPTDAGIVKLHNKGVLVDGKGVLVSSMNWNYNGAYENRETALYLVSEELAATFQRDFEEDWGRENSPPKAIIQGPGLLAIGEKGTFSGEASTDDISVVSYAWDLHGDGTWDGGESTFSFVPPEAGGYLLLLRVQDAEGDFDEAEMRIDVLPDEVVPLEPLALAISVASGLAAAVWFRKLRTRREPTNKEPGHRTA
ncbi:MAG: phospholipase D-like domain-containing protein [Thermoplasmata archaeon]